MSIKINEILMDKNNISSLKKERIAKLFDSGEYEKAVELLLRYQSRMSPDFELERRRYERRYERLTDERISLREELRRSKNELEDLRKERDIPLPKWENKKTEMQESLESLIKEMNLCYDVGAYTAVGLIARKFIINVVYVLSEYHNIKIADPDVDLNPNGEKRVYIISEDDSGIKSRITWLHFHRFLTIKDQDLLLKLNDDSNEISHKHNIENDKTTTSKYFLTIKGLIESNFTTKDIKFSNDISDDPNLGEETIDEIEN